MRLKYVAGLCLPILAVVLVGCETFGVPKDVRDAVYDTHRRVTNLDKSLESSVNKLNQTTAALVARVDETDEQTRRLRTVAEENQVKLDALARELAELKATAYRQWNLTGTVASAYTSPGTLEGEVGTVVLEQPSGESLTLAPAPDSASPFGVLPDSQTAVAAPAAIPGGVTYGDPTAQYRQAQKAFGDEDYQLALQLFDEHQQRYPDSESRGNAQFWKAICQMRLGNYQPALQDFEVLCQEHPTSSKVPFARYNQAVCHSRLGQVEKAIALMEDVVEQHPISPAADQAKKDLADLRGE